MKGKQDKVLGSCFSIFKKMKNQLRKYINLIEKLSHENPVLRIFIYAILKVLALLIIGSIVVN